MPEAPAQIETGETWLPAPVPELRLVVDLPSRPRVFLSNFGDLFRSDQAPLDLHSAPAPFWPDVFVARGLPWRRFVESAVWHGLAFGLIYAVSGFLALQPQAVPRAALAHDEVLYYTPEEYLPPLDTRQSDAPKPQKADPEYSAQPIISVPPEADNHAQTIVTPPDIKLRQDIALPNVVAWSERPRMPIAPSQVVPVSDLQRLSPQMENAVVAPAPNLTRNDQHRNLPGVQTSIIAPPPDVQAVSRKTLEAPQAAVIAPPPAVDSASTRRLGDINIGRSNVIAPAPRLPLDAQRALAGANSHSLSTQVVAPPPTLRSSAGSSSGAGGGRMIALNLHPAVGAPPDPPAGNRRGSFAAAPEGHRGASGTPGSSSGEAAGTDGHGAGKGKESDGGSGKNSNGLPAGLYVGKTNAGPASPVTGDPAASSSPAVNPNLLASARLPRISSSPSRELHPKTTPSSPRWSVRSSATASSTRSR